MGQKEFLDFYEVRNNGLILAKQILDDGFIPNVIYIAIRGGSVLANIISEYYSLFCDSQIDIGAVRIHSYSEVKMSQEIILDGWTIHPSKLNKNSKIMLVDDIFDSGKTINYLVQYMIDLGLKRENIKIVVHDYKNKLYDESQLKLVYRPDYYCRRFDISNKDDDNWIHYLSHELKGLTKEEFEKNYSEKYACLKSFKL